MPRDYVGYAGNPPRVEWPGGARLALNIVINYEEGAELGALETDTEREKQGETAYPPTAEGRELFGESSFEYGSRAGVWRILRILDKYQATCTVYACALALERNPAVVQAFLERGYDFVSHGYRWLGHFDMTEQEERENIRRARDSIQRSTGQPVIGWFMRAPQTLATRRILAEEGFVYDSYALDDDLPHFQSVGGRRFLIVPYAVDTNDGRFWRNTLFTPREFLDYMKGAFDVLYEEGASHPRMMSLGLHPRIIGRPGRAWGLDQFLAHVRQFPDVWIARRNDIARFWMERYG